MVTLANTLEYFQLGITLHVPGGIVTGYLIGGREYFERMAAHFLREGQDRNAAHDWMLSYGERYPKYDEEPAGTEQESVDERPPSLYIHLRDAHFVTPGSAPIPSNCGVLWRGTINSVAGWSMGVLAAGGES